MHCILVWLMRVMIELGRSYGGISTGMYDRSISISALNASC